jgi:serine/threonine protein kinase
MGKSGKDAFLGSQIREYQILESIGRGGMGAVYRARHVYLDKERAIKVVHRSLTESQDFVQRFIREAKVLSQLNHPNVVQLYDFGMLDENTFFMVMELIKGETVIERIQKQTRLSPDDSVRIIREAALGLSSAHKKGIIHRDISPDNLILVHDATGHEVTKVVDFGIAKPLHEDTGRFTMTNFFIGKPEYSSPEQCGTLSENESLDQRSDIYSLGVTFFQMLTGRLPFVASTPQGYLLKHAHEAPQAPSSYIPYGEIPTALDSVVMKALSKKREDRHRNLEEFIEELDHLSFTEGPTMTALDREAFITQRKILKDQTVRVDRDSVLPPFEFTTKDLAEMDAPTEGVEVQQPTEKEYAITTPLQQRQEVKRKSSGVGLAILLSAALFCLVVVGGFYAYKYWNDKTPPSSPPKVENKALAAAEKALRSGDDSKAEQLLKQAELEKQPGQEQRLIQLREGIIALRKQRQLETASSLLKSAKEKIVAGNLDQASIDIAELQKLNLPEFQKEIEAANTQIEEQQKKLTSQKEANEMFDDIRKALETGNIDQSESKLKDLKSGNFPGFEKQRALLEQQIAEAKRQANLQKGTKLLDEAENFIRRQRPDLAAERIERAQELQIASLNSRIDSLSARITSLQKSNDEAREKVQSLLSSARLLIQVGQPEQAQEWITQARSMNVPEFKAEIDQLSRQIKLAQQPKTRISALDAAEEALRRGDWIAADKALKIARANSKEGSEARLTELNRQMLAIRPYVGFGVRRKWEDADRTKHGVPFGAVVAKVDRGSPADRAGLRAGDVIVEYNGSVLVNDEQLPWLGAYSKPGSEVLLKVVRSGEPLTVRIQVISMLSTRDNT